MLGVDQRVFLVTGKGGVGKTTVAVGLARASVMTGRPATLIEFGDGESGARVLGASSGVSHRVAQSQAAVQAAADELLGSAILARAVTSNFAVKRVLRSAPALRELALLEFVRRIAEENPRHTIVVDMPASGHGLAWLRVPERLAALLVTGPLHNMAQRVQREIVSSRQTAVVLVTLPEKLVLEETVELAQGLKRELGLSPARIVINRVPARVPEEVDLVLKGRDGSRDSAESAELYRFLDVRREQRRQVEAALEGSIGGALDPVLLPLWPTDPPRDVVADWIERGGGAP
jgi:anion-transporting  ArsA/GET3 family ATPase